MSFLIPTNLSVTPGVERTQHGSELSEDNANSGDVRQNEETLRPQQNKEAQEATTSFQSHKTSTVPGMRNEIFQNLRQSGGSMFEPDEYGAELSRDARVWKVYVKETDQWDAELVDGWNKSLDVVLVFAALFSAVSTAFLIESSGRLKQDPNDVSATALLAISQALNILVNASSPSPTNLTWSETDKSHSFDPSNTAVIVNALWYLSLSLSIAASFLAMLAKDWCHSFASNRTGHAWDQAHRRQHKWMMIERWKMQELIVVLPSLIHLSLLLFAIGLCFYVWDLHQTTAIPVICVSGAAFSFYIWSSITASTVKFFPYTTIVSRVLLSEFALAHYQHTCKFAGLVSTFILAALSKLGTLAELSGSAILFTIKWIAIVVVRLILKLFHFLAIVVCARWVLFGAFALGTSTSSTISPSLALDIMFSGLAKRITEIIEQKVENFKETVKSFTTVMAHFLTKFGQSEESSLTQDRITSLALCWLIQHCETPSSVAIALQAISGASHRIPREPLVACQATLQILRRLVASSPDSGATSSTYVRALKVLGSHPLLGPGTKESGHIENTEVLIWDLKSAHEKQIVDLIQDMEFMPTEDNLNALSIGNAAASHSLRLLKGDKQSATKSIRKIDTLLMKYLAKGPNQLHPAAFQSIINAAALITSCSTSSLLSPALLGLCMEYCNKLCLDQSEFSLSLRVGNGVGLAICALLHGRKSEMNSSQTAIDINTCVQGVAHALMDNYYGGQFYQGKFFWVACLQLLSIIDQNELHSRSNDYKPLRNWCDACLPELNLLLSDPLIPKGDKDSIKNHNFALLKAMNQVYDIVGLSVPHDLSGRSTSINFRPKIFPAPLYIAAVRSTCLAQSNVQQTLGKRLFANFGFPELSLKLVRDLGDQYHTGGTQRTGLISLLSTTFKNQKSSSQARHFAATQLWLLLHLTGDSSTNNQKWLKQAMETDPTLELKRRGSNHVKQELETHIIDSYIRDQHLGLYSARVVECIYELRGPQSSSDLSHRAQTDLTGVPTSLRGIASFFSPLRGVSHEATRALSTVTTTDQPTVAPQLLGQTNQAVPLEIGKSCTDNYVAINMQDDTSKRGSN